MDFEDGKAKLRNDNIIYMLRGLPKVLRFFNYRKYLKINIFFNYQFSIINFQLLKGLPKLILSGLLFGRNDDFEIISRANPQQ
jgi:hypothetical protein